MRIILIATAIFAVATAGVIPDSDYLPPAEELVGELPLSVNLAADEQTNNLADDGYRYKTVRRLKYRNRRDVSELESNEYLPPTESDAGLEYLPPVESEAESAPIGESAVLADDGYRYRTVKRIRYRKRRQVSELGSNEYLPPTEGNAESELLPQVEPEFAPVGESTDLSDDGYRYKTIRRLKYRNRRDVSELESNEYLPPTESDAGLEYLPPVESEAESAPVEESAVLADDGYRYRTVKRIRYRKRRQVSELGSNEYLPPTEGNAASELLPEVEPEFAPVGESTVLSDDGYRYKTIRRLKYRNRRDVSELESNEYLPPTESDAGLEYLPPVESEAESAPIGESAVLADDGYRYRTVKRIRYRKRRQVSELGSNEYLPPTEGNAASELLPEVEPEFAPVGESTVLSDDGYRYKTIRRLKYRNRRDVSELESNEYLPPTENDASLEYLPPVESEAESAPIGESAVLADDGYRYRTVKRIRYRKRRQVSELESNEYLPPSDNGVIEEASESDESAILADDGYRYKTVRRLKYRN